MKKGEACGIIMGELIKVEYSIKGISPSTHDKA
jgi:hypothetical protein